MNNKDTIIEALTMQLRIEREANLALAKQAKPNCENCESLRKAAWDRIAELEDALEKAVLAEPTWHCPLKKPDCKENCGSYGCGN